MFFHYHEHEQCNVFLFKYSLAQQHGNQKESPTNALFTPVWVMFAKEICYRKWLSLFYICGMFLKIYVQWGWEPQTG